MFLLRIASYANVGRCQWHITDKEAVMQGAAGGVHKNLGAVEYYGQIQNITMKGISF